MIRLFLLICSLLFIVACGNPASPATLPAVVSDIEADETLLFFNTSGWLDETKQEWHLPIHGWIYEAENSTVRKAAFERILSSQYDLIVNDEAAANFSRRINLLIADNERGKTIIIDIAGRHYPLTTSQENGHFETTLVLPAADLHAIAENQRVSFSAVTANNELRIFGGTVQLVGPAGLSIISDIDDTVKVSNVGDRRSLLEQTFLRDFLAVPGMADRYQEWTDHGASVHYVSSSPWQLYAPLDEFLTEANFPWATFSLKAVRFRDETLLNLFKDGTETKPAAIREILDQYPNRQFVLIGDSGEQDPEVYAMLLRERPQQVTHVFIRNVTNETADNERFAKLFVGIEKSRWLLFQRAEALPRSFPSLPVSMRESAMRYTSALLHTTD